jgi:hypothetical protein
MEIGEKVRVKETEIVGTVFDVGKHNPNLVIMLLDEPQKSSSSKGTMLHCLFSVHSTLLERVVL